MTTTSRPLASAEALETLAQSLSTLDPDPASAGDNQSRVRDHIVNTINFYLLPRLSGSPRPLTVVFAGPTGAGKSTLINSIARRELSETGPLRPTTTVPYVYALDSDSDSYSDLGGVECVVVPGKAPVLRTMTLVDTPDIDSTAAEHRVRAEKLIDAADIVVFISSAMRYADRVPWEVLRRARSRGAPVVCVLNRVGSTSDAAVHDYRRMLLTEGLGESLLAIGEHHLAGPFLPLGSVRSLRDALVSQVESHRLDESATTRRVLDAVCREADELLESVRSALSATPGPVLDLTTPVMPLLGDHGYGALPIDQLVAGSRMKVRWAVRRMRRDATMIAGEQARLADSMMLQLDRWALRARGGLSADLYQIVRETVDAWAHDIDLPASRASRRNQPLAGLLARIAAACTTSWPSRVLEIVTRADPTLDVEAARNELDTILAETLAPAIEVSRAQRTLMDRVDQARDALSEVIVSVAFVDA